jgi:hypothetical protein
MKEPNFENQRTFEDMRTDLVDALRSSSPVGPGVQQAAEALWKKMEEDERARIKAEEGETFPLGEEIERARDLVKEKLLRTELIVRQSFEQAKIYHELGYSEDAEESWNYAAIQCQQEMDALDSSRRNWPMIERNLAITKAIASNYGEEVPAKVMEKIRQAETLLEQGRIEESRYARLDSLYQEVWEFGKTIGAVGS